MKMNLTSLQAEVEVVLKTAGFSPELYIIKVHDDCVSVHFDKKEAVDYFRVDFEAAPIAKDCIFEYKKVGKRHAAYIYNW
jgi:hypothetical protein